MSQRGWGRAAGRGKNLSSPIVCRVTEIVNQPFPSKVHALTGRVNRHSGVLRGIAEASTLALASPSSQSLLLINGTLLLTLRLKTGRFEMAFQCVRPKCLVKQDFGLQSSKFVRTQMQIFPICAHLRNLRRLFCSSPCLRVSVVGFGFPISVLSVNQRSVFSFLIRANPR
jgi:hypothetical protein